MRFSPKKIIWLFFSSVLILQPTSFSYATGADLDEKTEEFRRLSALSKSIRSIESKEHKKDLSTIATQKWKYFNGKLERKRLESEVSEGKFEDITLLDMLDVLEKPDARSQKNLNDAILKCTKFAEETSGRLRDFFAFTPKVFEIFRKLGPLQITSESSDRPCSLLYLALKIRPNGSLDFDPEGCDYLISHEWSKILNISVLKGEKGFLDKMADLESDISYWFSSFEGHYQGAEVKNFQALGELEAFDRLIPVDAILTLPNKSAKAAATRLSELDAVYEKANQRFQVLKVLRESINGFKEWVSLQNKYFEELKAHKASSKL